MSDPMPARRYPRWLLRNTLIVQALFAALFWWLLWDFAVLLAQGRPASAAEIVIAGLPFGCVVVLGLGSLVLWRGDHRQLSIACALVPFIVALILLYLMGAI